MIKQYNVMAGSTVFMQKPDGYSSFVLSETVTFTEDNLVRKDQKEFHFCYQNINLYTNSNCVVEA